MRILLLMTQSLESPGGAGRFFPMARAAAAKGVSVKILALHHDYSNLKEKKIIDPSGVVIEYVGQMHVLKRGNTKQYFNVWRMMWIVLLATLRLTWFGLRTPCDIVQICKPQPMNGLAGLIIKWMRNVPVVVDTDDHEAENNRFSGRWQQRIVRFFEDNLARTADYVFVGNQYLLDYFLGLGLPDQKFEIMRNGVEKNRFAMLDHPESASKIEEILERLSLKVQTILVYVGSMSLTNHAVDLMLDAFQVVQKKHPHIHLLLVGGGEDIAKLNQFANQLGISDSITFTGRIPSGEIPYYYRLGLFSIDPHRDTAADESSFSLKLIESQVAGTPCVSTDIGDRRLAAGEGALFCTPNDVDDLANTMELLLINSDLRNKLHQAALANRQKHFWGVKIDRYLQVYQILLNQRY